MSNNSDLDHEKISGLRLTSWGPNFKEEFRPFYPKTCINSISIPQTMYDQIWLAYEFENKQIRKEWEESLPEKFQKMLDRSVIKQCDEHGSGWR